MKAMVLNCICNLAEKSNPLELRDMATPSPGPTEILVRVSACGVCHTELDEIEGRTPPPTLPVVPGHQVIGRVVQMGPGVKKLRLGDRVGVGWIYDSCGKCTFCLEGRENLCSNFRATGRDVNGGYAEYMAVREDFACAIPDTVTDVEAAPLLCAGAVGYRSMRLTGMKNGQNLGLTGFGASAHLVLKMARYLYPESAVFVFARNKREREFAMELGAAWAGDISEKPTEKLDCIIDTTPAWKPVVEAMKNLKAGGRLVINAIGKEETDRAYLLHLDYPKHLWLEKEIKSVANVTRRDLEECLLLAARIPVTPQVQTFALEEANSALMELKEGKIRGGKVLKIT